MKGLILCAGKGTRLQPFSFSQPKTLLPVVNKSVLEYCLENLAKSGIEEIGIVMHPSQEAIPELIGDGKEYGCKVDYIYQMEQKGISHAVRQAESFIGQDPFILLLGDNLIAEDLQTLIGSYQQHNSNGAILLSSVSNPQDFGIAEIKGNDIIGLEEKPEKPKSNLAVIGAYLFDSHIFEAVNTISPSARGEYEITDAIQWLIDRGHSISYTITKMLYSDVGTIERWLEANKWMMKRQFEDQIIIGKDTIVENCTFKGPVVIGDNCVLKNAEIGPYVSIQNHGRIENCRIESSILLEGTELLDLKYPVSHSVFGRNVKLDGGMKGKENAMNFYLGDKSSIKMSWESDE